MGKKGQRYAVLQRNGFIVAVIGNTYTGTGFVGLSDGVKVTGRLAEYDQRNNSVTLEDERGQWHSVIPSTLREP